ncbi:MAG: hypothetical protein ACI3VK_03050 [Oscillospiraceae bacterium]
MRIIKKWVGRQPENTGEIKLLEVSQAEMFEQMYPLLGQLALHATSGHDVDYRLYLICEEGKRILPVDKPSVMSGAFNGGKNPLADCEPVSADKISDLVDTAQLLPAVEASKYLFKETQQN